MSGYILLEGGAEFSGQMAVPDRRAIELAGGLDARISIIPAAAALDRNHERAGQNGLRWFKSLGAREVVVLPLVDQASANLSSMAALLRRSRLVYLLGGFPHHLAQTLAGSLSWHAILEAYHAGAVIGGSSAGAMVLCGEYYDPLSKSVIKGLNLVGKACIIPHHNAFGSDWAAHLMASLPERVIVGIDEETGMIDDGDHGQWKVYGKGSITLYRDGEPKVYPCQGAFSL